MPRQPRLGSDTGTYHVMLRGINRQRIFEEPADYGYFLDSLTQAVSRSEASVFAYALMPNHAHLVLAEGRESVSALVKRLAVRYAGWFNWKYGRVGHVFQDRFASRPVDTDEYFLTVIQYVHFNPVVAGLCRRPEDYPWSSRCTLGRPGSLVDLPRLERIVPLPDLLHREAEYRPPRHDDDTLLSLPAPRPRMTDTAARDICARTLGTAHSGELINLPCEQQRDVVRALRANHLPVRRISCLTGLGLSTIHRLST